MKVGTKIWGVESCLKRIGEMKVGTKSWGEMKFGTKSWGNEIWYKKLGRRKL